MKELLQALDEFLIALVMFERTHTEQTHRLMDRKLYVLNQVRRKYQRAAELAAAQAALFVEVEG